MATAKSFTELGKIYQKDVLLNEGAKTPTQKQTVGGKQEIGDVKLTKEGGDEKVKKDLEKPVEASAKDKGEGDVDKLSQKETVKESSNVKSKSLFDKIYEQIVSEENDPLDLTPEAEDSDVEDPADASGEAVEGEEGEEEVVDPVAVVKQICDLVGKLKTHFGIEDEAVVELDPAVPAVGEAVDAKELPDSKGLELTKKNKADVKGVKVVSKKASTDVTTGDGKLEKAPDGTKLAGNKGAGTVKGEGAATKGSNASALE
jgi:hypothetical protein